MNVYLVLILVIIIGDYLLDIVVETLNLRHLSTDLPQDFEGFYDAEKYTKAQHYLIENTRFGIIVNSITTPLTIIFILIGGFNFVDQYARGFTGNPLLAGLIFAGILMLAPNCFPFPFQSTAPLLLKKNTVSIALRLKPLSWTS
jgi:STE24 endopeptidase